MEYDLNENEQYILDVIDGRISYLNQRERNSSDVRQIITDKANPMSVVECNKFDYDFYLETHRLEIELFAHIDLVKGGYSHLFSDNLKQQHSKLEQSIHNDTEIFSNLFARESDRMRKEIKRENINKDYVTDDPDTPGCFKIDSGVVG